MFPQNSRQNLPAIGKTYPPEGNSYGYIYAWKDQSIPGVLGKDIVWVVRELWLVKALGQDIIKLVILYLTQC